MDTPCDACKFLQKPVHEILRTDYWNVELAQNQAYLGRAFVTLLAHKPSLGELSSEEWQDFEVLVKKLEAIYRQAFGADPLNWSCLMNGAYLQKPFNAHVHWHLIPRYENAVQIDELTFTDEEFGHIFEPFKERLVGDRTVESIAQKIKAFL